jgi:malate dehydrogenase (oxaloacetate-decarboxylating)(NADP+)
MTRQSDDPGRGVKLLHDPVRNKGTAFTAAEREALGLQGLLPPRIHTIAEQEQRVLANLRTRASDLDRYLFLMDLQNRNETLFYHVVMNHIEETMPLIYTPTVGLACQAYGHIFRRPRGLFITTEDRGRVETVLGNWPHRDARICVVTDGERILGLGDLGADGMGIPVGKLALYTACAGTHPTQCLPVTIDAGTDNEALLADPLYIGTRRRRLRGPEYDALIEEFVTAAERVFPGLVIQLEDFGNRNAFRLLQTYRERACVFDDDIQGTGAVACAGVLGALRISGQRLAGQRFLFLGAGEAGIGIAATIVAAMSDAGMTPTAARQACWFVDTQGLLTAARAAIPPHKQPFAHEHAPLATLQEAIEALRPTVLIGSSGQPGLFTETVVRAMARHNARPVIFALSNPTSKAECTAEQAYAWSEGRAVFASGSPFAPLTHEGITRVPGQCNNAYIFPGVGLGLVASRARRVTDAMFLAAAKCLAAQVGEDDLALGRVYPPLARIREVSVLIAREVAEIAWASGLAERERPADPLADIRAQMFTPEYPDYAV